MQIAYHTHPLPHAFTHAHEEIEITYCVQGTYAYHYETAPGQYAAKRITPRMMIFMPQGVNHGVTNVEYPYRRYLISIPVRQAVEWLDDRALLSPLRSFAINEVGGKQFFPLFLDTATIAPTVENLLERMMALQVFSDVNHGHTDLHMKCLFGLLFCELSHHFQDFFANPAGTRSSLATDVRAFIDQHYAQPLTIQGLAKRHFVHPNYLTHCFTRQIGISPRKYLTHLRLANARKLLVSEDDSVQNIALRVGYSNVNNFIQSFRQRYGVTPKAYRKKAILEVRG